MLYNDTISSIMGFLSLKDCSLAAQTCKKWRGALLNNSVILYKGIAQNEFAQTYKQRHIAYAPLCVRTALTTAEKASDMLIPNSDIAIPNNDRNKRILELIEGYIEGDLPEEVPVMVPIYRNPRQMYLEPFFGERAWRLGGVNPGVIPPFPIEVYKAILKEPRPFTGTIIPVLLPEMANGEGICLDVLQKIYRAATGTGYGYYFDYSKAERVRHGQTPMGPSSWYLMSIVVESGNKPFDAQMKLVRPNDQGPWEVASATQVMALEVLSLIATGRSFLGDLWARTPQKTQQCWRLAVLGGSASRAPKVDYDGYGYGDGSIVVVALRKLTALGT